MIKKFVVELVREKVMKNGIEYQKGINSLTFEALDCKIKYI